MSAGTLRHRENAWVIHDSIHYNSLYPGVCCSVSVLHSLTWTRFHQPVLVALPASSAPRPLPPLPAFSPSSKSGHRPHHRRRPHPVQAFTKHISRNHENTMRGAVTCTDGMGVFRESRPQHETIQQRNNRQSLVLEQHIQERQTHDTFSTTHVPHHLPQ